MAAFAVAPAIYKPFALVALILLAEITFRPLLGLETALSQKESFRKIENNIDELEARIASLRSEETIRGIIFTIETIQESN